MKAGVIVQINSINVPWFKYLYTIEFFEELKFLIIANNIQNTEILIRTKKKKIESCNCTIPSKPGAALSWKPNCQGSATSL